MTRYLLATSKVDALEVKRITKIIFFLPRSSSQRIGGGVHGPRISITDYLQPLKHPTQQMWACEITQEMKDVWSERKSMLSASERAFIQSLLVSETELDATWEGATIDV